MLKKIIFGLIFLIIILLVLIFAYKENLETKKISTDIKIKIEEENINSSNIIKDINYSSKDLDGNEYIIYAKEGEIDLVNTDIIFLKDVTAYIKLKKKSETVIITSNFGKYNSVNYDTIFTNNVKIEYVDNVITSEYLDFSMINNLIIITKNVVYKNLENILKADVIEIDIKTKDTKIFMHDINKKVNIKSIN